MSIENAIVESDRIKIRPFVDADFEFLVAMMSDAETMQYTGFKEPQSVEKVKELLEKWKVAGLSSLGTWAVDSVGEEKCIGWSMLKMTDSEEPELGYMLAKEHWGKGFASEIARELMFYASTTLKLDKIRAITSPENHASVRVLEKIGMKPIEKQNHPDGGVIYEVDFRE